MLKQLSGWIVFSLLLIFPMTLLAQDGVKVVPIGQTIKPEAGSGGGGKKRPRRRYRAPVVKEGTSFIIELGTAVSSGLTKEGETITIRSTEDVDNSKRPGIKAGAAGRGTVSQVDKKGKKVVIRLESIDSYNGTPVNISGDIEIKSNKGAASAAVGERFTATLGEKITVKPTRSSRRSKKKGSEPQMLTGFIEISGKGVKADLKKGRAKGKVKMVLEAPKGFTADDIVANTVRLAMVNGNSLSAPVSPTAQKPKQGDANKNGTTDWTMFFDAWDFVKNQPEGMNTVVVKGNLKNGETFEATTRVKVNY